MNVTYPIHRNALRMARKPAVIAGGNAIPYGALDALVWSAAAEFRDQGLRAGDRVGLAIAQQVRHLVAALALARIGVACHALAPGDRPEAIAALAARIGARAIVRNQDGPNPGAPGGGGGVPAGLATVTLPTTLRSRRDLGGADFADNPDGILRFAASSGTTGRPKLFAIGPQTLATLMDRYRLSVPISAGDVSLTLVDLCFLSSMRRALQDLCAGATVVLYEHADPNWIAETVRHHAVTRLYAGPWLMPRLLARTDLDAVFRRLTILECSGSTVDASLRQAVLERYTGGLVVNYGANELHPLATAIGAACLSAPDTVGWPVPRGRFEIVDDSGRRVGPGQTGQVRVRDEGMIGSYWDDEAATRASFRDGWFHPGDLAQWSARGEILFKGRADDLIIFDGINVYPGEIENCLTQHPLVLEAAAFGLPHAARGAIPVAAVRVSAPTGPDELEDFCRERLGVRYPRKVLALAELPRNPRGKVLKSELTKLFRAAD